MYSIYNSTMNKLINIYESNSRFFKVIGILLILAGLFYVPYYLLILLLTQSPIGLLPLWPIITGVGLIKKHMWAFWSLCVLLISVVSFLAVVNFTDIFLFDWFCGPGDVLELFESGSGFIPI